jgi:hypothetical protein
VKDAGCDLEKLVLSHLEKLVTRVGLEDVDQRLVAVAGGGESCAFQHAFNLAAHDGRLPGVGVIGTRCVEP